MGGAGRARLGVVAAARAARHVPEQLGERAEPRARGEAHGLGVREAAAGVDLRGGKRDLSQERGGSPPRPSALHFIRANAKQTKPSITRMVRRNSFLLIFFFLLINRKKRPLTYVANKNAKQPRRQACLVPPLQLPRKRSVGSTPLSCHPANKFSCHRNTSSCDRKD